MSSGKNYKSLISSCVFGAAAAFLFVFGTAHNAGASTSAPVENTVNIILDTSCTMSGGSNSQVTLNAGTVTSVSGTSDARVTCNDAGGYGIFAIGYSGDIDGSNKMLSSVGSQYDITTGTATSGSVSNWAMKVTPGSGVTSQNDFNSFHAVPTTWTKVAQKASGIDTGTTTAISTNYQIYASTTQPAGTYTGKVKYVLVNPSTQSCPDGYELKDGTCQEVVPTISTITNMQDMTPAICTASAENETNQLKDTRDNTAYTVTKLADGKCWMLDNLALDLTNNTVKTNLTSSTTNASDTSLGYLKNGGGTTSDKYATAGVANWTSSYSYSAPLINMSNKDNVPSDSLSTAGGWKVGGHYNYCAASAGSYCYGNGTSEGTSSGNATEDICPKGWRMPGGSDTIDLTATPPTGEYRNLYTNYYKTYADYRNALSLPLSGYFYNGSARNQGSDGRFWSSTRRDNNYMYRLSVGTSDINPAYNGNRSSGNSIRCVAGS